MQNCQKAGPNTENIVQLASAGVNLPEIYAANPLSVRTVDSAKTSAGIPLLSRWPVFGKNRVQLSLQWSI